MAVYVALVHYPVVDKHGKTVTTSVTNFDIHDLARCAKTYGVRKLYIVNPVPSQHWFAERIIKHWTEGFGAEYNPTRQEALDVITLASDLMEVADAIAGETGREARFVATSARRRTKTLSYEELRSRIAAEEEDICLLLGTAWGLHPSILVEVDYFLEPIRGVGEWNHLSVRSAAAIILDRLLGR